MKGINLEELLNKRVKIKAYSDNEYVGIVTSVYRKYNTTLLQFCKIKQRN